MGETWAERAVATPDDLERALAGGRPEEAAALARRLVTEAQETHDLYTAWAATIPEVLAREGVLATTIDDERRRLVELTGARDPEGDWRAFCDAVDRFAREPRSGDVEEIVAIWRSAHDAHRDLVAGWVDVAVRALGEARLGDLWRVLQADGIAEYARYDVRANPWPESFSRLLAVAIEGMHGHLGGPRGRGEIEVAEHDDRVALTFSPCGSGGRLRAAERFGVTSRRYDWAWNEVGVCHYCVHCCVLQQLEPIDRLGYPARVIDPPLSPGEPCTWTVYRDPALVPESAYTRVGRTKPGEAS